MERSRRRLARAVAGGLPVLAFALVVAFLLSPGPAPPRAGEACRARTAGLLAGRPSAGSPAVVALGRRLFGDARLSSDRSVSCASCHQPDRAFTDGRRVSVGVGGREGSRNAPTLVNLAFARHFLWDGRASSLEEQVRIALREPNEMGIDDAQIRGRLRELDGEFRSALGRGPGLRTVSEAIAAHVRTIIAGGSRADLFLYCGRRSALTVVERRGLRLFEGEANCVRCHVIRHESTHPFGGEIALFTDDRFHNIGAGDSADPGRAAVTGSGAHFGAFKTPTLRNVALTAPYMHDGSLRTLRQVVEFYNRGGGANARLDPNIHPLGLSASEVTAIVAFLESLTSPDMEPAARPTT